METSNKETTTKLHGKYWAPKIDKLPDIVRLELDKELDKYALRRRRLATVRALLKSVRHDGWPVKWEVEDEDGNLGREIYDYR